MARRLIKGNTCKRAGKGKHVITGNYRARHRQSQSSHTVDEETAELPPLMGFSLCSNASQRWTRARLSRFGFKTPPVAVKIFID